MSYYHLCILLAACYHIIIDCSLVGCDDIPKTVLEARKFFNACEDPDLKKEFATKLFKREIGYPNPHQGPQLNPLQKSMITIAHSNGAHCNLKVPCGDKSIGLVDFLIYHHENREHAITCQDKLLYLLGRSLVDVNEKDANGFFLVAVPKTFSGVRVLFDFISQRDEGKRRFADRLFKETIGCPSPQKGSPLTYFQEKMLDFAQSNGADCNPTIQYKNKKGHVLDFLVFYYANKKYNLTCRQKLAYLVKKLFVDINAQEAAENPDEHNYPLWYACAPSTLDFLLSLGLEINQVDECGRNFAMKVCCDAAQESKGKVEPEKECYESVQALIDCFYKQGGDISREDKEGNNILYYVIKYGLSFATSDFIESLLFKFDEFFKSTHCVFNDTFKHELLLMMAQSDQCFLNISQDITVQKSEMKRLKGILEVFYKWNFNIINQVASFSYEGKRDHLKTVDASLYRSLIETCWYESRKTYEQDWALRAPENNIIFSFIINKKLEQYSRSSNYRERLATYYI